MAQIDFSNARIEVSTTSPLDRPYIGISDAKLADNIGGTVISNPTYTLLEVNEKKAVLRYTGTISAGYSGTYFYLYSDSAARWKVSNISFSGGDTYDFTIGANITCN